jgi:murein hydrolase activator
MKMFVGTILLLLICAFNVSAEADKKDSGVRALEARLSAERERLEAFHGREKELITRVEALDMEIKLKRAEISKLRDLIRAGEKEQEAILEELESLEEEISSRYRAVGDKLVALYKHARGGYARMLFGVEGFDLFRRTVKYVSSMVEEDARILNAHAASVRACEEKRAGLDRELLKNRERRASQTQSLGALEKHLDRIILKLVNTHKEKEFYETAVNELKLASGELRNTITEIEKRSDGRAVVEKSKDELIGAIPLPADGKVIVPAAAGSSAGRHGIFIEVPPGTEVRAVLPGRVEFSGPVKGYGQAVIINHGGRLYTISSHLGLLKLNEGKTVRAGELVGVAGDRDGKGVVYFEIRHAGSPVDTRLWLRSD